MTTRDIMAARIANEVGQRTDIDTEIVEAITTAVGAYQDKSFWFAKKRGTLVITTIASQADYDSDDYAQIPLIQRIDFAKVLVDTSIIYDLGQIPQTDMELLLVNENGTNIPTRFSYYDSTLWFYPKPAAAYTIRVAGVFAVAAPATGVETGNPWMIYAERLIRSRAKLELGLHTINDDDLVQKMTPAANEALLQLVNQSNMKGRTDKGRVKSMEF